MLTKTNTNAFDPFRIKKNFLQLNYILSGNIKLGKLP